MFFIQVVNAFVPDLMSLVKPPQLLRTRFLSHFAGSQEMLILLVRPPDFALARRYTDALRTLGFMVFFSPILPPSPFIAFAGLLFSYATDKYVALRVARLPNELSARATATLNTVVKLLPLGQILMVRFAFFPGARDANAVFGVSLTVWVLFSFAPQDACLGVSDGALEDAGTGGMSFHTALASGHMETRAGSIAETPKASTAQRRPTEEVGGGSGPDAPAEAWSFGASSRGDSSAPSGAAAAVAAAAAAGRASALSAPGAEKIVYCPTLRIQGYHSLRKLFEVPREPFQATARPMPGQNPRSGGMCTRAPPRERMDRGGARLRRLRGLPAAPRAHAHAEPRCGVPGAQLEPLSARIVHGEAARAQRRKRARGRPGPRRGRGGRRLAPPEGVRRQPAPRADACTPGHTPRVGHGRRRRPRGALIPLSIVAHHHRIRI